MTKLYTIDEPIAVDGRSTTLRRELGAHNARLQHVFVTTGGSPPTRGRHCIVVFRGSEISAVFDVSRDTYDAVQNGSAWQPGGG